MKGRVTLRVKSDVVQTVLETDDRVRVGDDLFHVMTTVDNAWRVTEPSGSTRIVHVVASREGHWVHVDGNIFLIQTGDGERSAEHGSDPLGGLTAPMPATVLSIVSPAGTQVEAGDVVLILEAMKMELPIRAPHGGVVTALHCSEGQLVQPGVALAEIA